MEKIPPHKILEFHPDTFEYVRKELGLDKPGQMDAAIDLLDDWVKKQAHFTKKDFPREYLERTIILDKGSVERAKLQMDKLFTMKTVAAHMFKRTDAKLKEFEYLHEYYVDALLPKLTKDHHRIYAGKIRKDGTTAHLLSLSYSFGSMIFEHIRAADYCAGFIGLLDYRNINVLDFVAAVNIMEMHQFISFITEGYQLRVKGIHILTTSKAIDLVVRIFKQIFSKKIGDRIIVHMSEESLYEYLPKELLPEEFGGDLKSLVEINRDWVEVLGEKENMEYFKQMNEAKINENLRDGGTKDKDEIFGISGSFRTLTVD